MLTIWIRTAVSIVVLSLAALLGSHPVLAAQAHVSMVQEMTISGAVHNLSAIEAITVSSRGTIAIAQPQDYRFAFFDAAGNPLGTFGRSGEGPGDFRSMHGEFGWRGDTLWVVDNATSRVTFVGPGLALLGSLPSPPSLLPPASNPSDRSGSLGRPVIKAVTAQRDLVLVLSINASTILPSWLSRPPTGNFVVRALASGTFKRFVAAMPQSPPRCTVTFDGGSIGIPFCARPLFSIANDGRRIVQVLPGLDGSHVRFIGIGVERGDTAFDRQLRFDPVEIPRTVSDSSRQASITRAKLQPAVKAAFESLQYPKTYPLFDRIIDGADGTIWIELSGSESGHRWLIFSAKGILLGELALPQPQRLAVATQTTVWVIETAEDGLQGVARFRLTFAQPAHGRN